MRGLKGTALLSAFALLGLAGVANAGTVTTTVGQLFPPTFDCVGQRTYLQTGVADGNSYVIPRGGVMTEWTFRSGATPVVGLELKVGHETDTGYVIDAEAVAGPQTPNAANSYPVNIPVVAGQMIGIAHNGGNCITQTGPAEDLLAFDTVDVGPGGALEGGLFNGYRLPVSAVVITETPETTITKRPPNRSEGSTVRYRFRSDEAGSTFQCKLKGPGLRPAQRRFRGCASPKRYKNLKPGSYRFQIRAVDAEGNRELTPAGDRFRVLG